MNHYNLLTAYLCWLTLGWFGAHHFYLRRNRHAFVWFWTCGGFVFGWLFEVWRIPDYVRTANAESENAGSTVINFCIRRAPAVRLKRLLGEFVFSGYLGFLAIWALPNEVLCDCLWISSAIGAFAVATGVHTIANIGKEKCRFKYCLLGAFLHFPIFFLGTVDTLYTSIIWSSLLSTICASYLGRRMRRKIPARHGLFKRLTILFICNVGMMSLFFLGIYFHGEIRLANGSRLKARVLVDEYFTSQHWQEIKQKAKHLWCVFLDQGIEMFLRHFSTTINPEGEQNAYKVLGLSWNATQEDIRNQYRKLVKMYHPDKWMKNTSEQRREAEVKFIEIQQSYKKLARKRRKWYHFY